MTAVYVGLQHVKHVRKVGSGTPHRISALTSRANYKTVKIAQSQAYGGAIRAQTGFTLMNKIKNVLI